MHTLTHTHMCIIDASPLPTHTRKYTQRQMFHSKSTAGGSAYAGNNILLESLNKSCGHCVQLTVSKYYTHTHTQRETSHCIL